MSKFDLVAERLQTAKGITWDTCHKIYILMDDEQVAEMRTYGYGSESDPDSLVTSAQMSPSEEVTEWWQTSCDLRFISATTTAPEGTLFENLITQFEEVI
jgi:hypothetical protein